MSRAGKGSNPSSYTKQLKHMKRKGRMKFIRHKNRVVREVLKAQ